MAPKFRGSFSFRLALKKVGLLVFGGSFPYLGWFVVKFSYPLGLGGRVLLVLCFISL